MGFKKMKYLRTFESGFDIWVLVDEVQEIILSNMKDLEYIELDMDEIDLDEEGNFDFRLYLDDRTPHDKFIEHVDKYKILDKVEVVKINWSRLNRFVKKIIYRIPDESEYFSEVRVFRVDLQDDDSGKNSDNRKGKIKKRLAYWIGLKLGRMVDRAEKTGLWDLKK